VIEYIVNTPSIPIPFHKLLKIVALVDANDREIKPLLERIAGERFEIEVSSNYDRDATEDAEVGAYIVAVDGDRLEPARQLARAIRKWDFTRRYGRSPIRTASPTRSRPA
jgi:ornithine decarboxylase